LKRLVSEGGMGVVYRARDTKLDRDVALKFLPPELTRDPEAKARFIHEARAASALDHPNICTIHAIDETPEGQMFLVMPAYEGIPLNKKIDQAPLPINEAIDIAIQIADGLQTAHEKGIVHRDIKSSNIFITSKGQVKVMDFGLARSAGMTQVTKTGTTVGTVPYMSPEQARGEKVDHRTDIWSLGVILYEMITGRMPFRSDYSEAIVYSIFHIDITYCYGEDIDRRPAVSEPERGIGARLLCRGIARRAADSAIQGCRAVAPRQDFGDGLRGDDQIHPADCRRA
jgi:eukaryotic-like serine/threonine-protein kinase